MTPEEIVNIKNKITDLKSSIDDIQKTIAALKIDKQLVLSANSIIPPGIGCRITFDSKGLVLKGEDLRIEDVPELPLEKITGLKKMLDDKLESSILDSMNKTNSRSKIKSGTGLRINYDEDGFVTSSSDSLLPTDIPDLSMTKITGLNDKLDFLESKIDNVPKVLETPATTITPGTFTKITFGADGKVLSGTTLSMDDIPIDFINKMNTIESRIPVLASQQTVDALSKDVMNKLDSNKLITSGTFTKVTVDEKGLVTLGDKLTINDLPEIQMKDITGLEILLRKKANQSDLVDLMNTVSSMNSNGQSSDIMKLQNDIATKATHEELSSAVNKVENLQHTIENLVTNLPSEFIVNQLKDIQDKLTTLTGRITILENQFKVNNSSSNS